MSSIITRVTAGGGATVKNSPLSNAEIDTNFINLNVDKVENSDSVSTKSANKVVRRDANGGFAAGDITVDTITTGSVTYPTTEASQAHMEAGTDTTTRYMSPANVKQAIDTIALQTIGAISKDLNGFETRSNSTLTFNESTRTLTLTPVGTCVVWHRGKKITISSNLTFTFSNTSFNSYIKLDPVSVSLVSATNLDIQGGDIPVAYIYWDSVNGKAVVCGDERHSASRDTQWHHSKHSEAGAVWKSGGELTYSINSPSVVTIGLASPLVLADEDIEHSITHNSSPSGYYQQDITGTAKIPVVYLEGTEYAQLTAGDLPWLAGSNTARYNPISGAVGSLSDAGEGKYISYWIVATNDMAFPVKAFMGRQSHNTIIAALEETVEEYGLPFVEFAPLYQVILQTSATYVANPSKVKLVSVREITSHQSVARNFTGLNHSGFSNLTKDDHLQYMHVDNDRNVTANHSYSGTQSFNGSVRTPTKPVINNDVVNKRYADQQALILSLFT